MSSIHSPIHLGSPPKRPKLDNPSDDEVELLTPSRFPNSGTNNNSNNSVSLTTINDDDIVITSSTTVNPNIDYPHIRPHCGVYAFTQIHATNEVTDNECCCEKCYCYVCDVPWRECLYWTDKQIVQAKSPKDVFSNDGDDDANLSSNDKSVGNKVSVDNLIELGPHCNAYSGEKEWTVLKEYIKRSKNQTTACQQETNDCDFAAAAQAAVCTVQNPYNGTSHSAALHDEASAILQRLASNNNNSNAATTTAMERIRARKEMRIPEVLLENFRNVVTLQQSKALHSSKMEREEEQNTKQHQNKTGDIPSLDKSPTYIEGIPIGFPFPKILKPQRQIMFHLIRALKNKKHVVIESPTGTGKSAAILCGVLAWQRWHWKRSVVQEEEMMGAVMNGKHGEGGGKMKEEGKVRVIYCSRTHSQVTQMVTSLKSTPYRPRMAILGSRDRLCIHKSIKPRTPGAEPIPGINVNNECRIRVRNTEKYRKHKLTNMSINDEPYFDEDPPNELPGDGTAEAPAQDGPQEGEEENNFTSRSRTCPHYRQLTANRVANLAHSSFVPSNKVDCCSIGGKKSKYGAHDIEDLVEFGKDPYLQTGVALYRGSDSDSYGLTLKGPKRGSGGSGGCFVQSTKKGSPADISGSLNSGDKILRVNGCDVTRESVANVAKRIKESAGDSLLLDVSRGGEGTLSTSERDYSSHAACPYYISQMLAKDADLVFCPYNYVLDPQIRNAMGIDLKNAVVVLDEGHNIESTLREAGSGRFGEFEICDLLVMLVNYSVTEKTTVNMVDVEEGDSMYLCDVAHALLLFVEKLATTLRESRQTFERNPGPKGAEAALRDYEKFHHSDDTEFEIALHGPTGNGVRGCAVGCKPFFEQLGILQSDLETLVRYVDAFERFCRGQESNESFGERDRISNLTDRLMDLVHKMCSASTKSEHYYAATVACANGSLDFANGVDPDGGNDSSRRWKKKPRAFPLVSPRTPQNPNRPPNPCLHSLCKARCPNVLDPIRHGQCCDGSTPKWEAVLNLQLLTPGPLFQELADECRTVVLASGSLAPIPSLCAELNLFSEDTHVALPSTPSSSSKAIVQKRLQTQPRPLEADHVVNLDKQLFVTSIGYFPDGSELQVSHRHYSKIEFLEKLGDSIVKIVEGITTGGVLVFLPSYALLRKCERLWNHSGSGSNRRTFWSQVEESEGPSVWDRLKALKHNVIMEPSGSDQTEFEEKKREYMNSVDQHGGCVLFAVYRGKMSEGISFNDNYARGVICIGVPLPNTFALPVKIKMSYNDEQRKLKHRTDLLPGREWYSQQAYRAIAQALGRCIRHSADYGAIFLLDSRHCDNGMPNDGIPTNHKNLPKWMRTTVRNLCMNSTPRNSMFNYGSSSKIVCGGYPGLKKELQKFFRDVKPFVASVSQAQKARPTGASQSAQAPQFTPPPGSSRAPSSVCSGSSSLVVESVQHIHLSTTTSKSSTMSTESDGVVVLGSMPPKRAEGVKFVPKQNSLMTAFQRQRENEPAAKPSSKAYKSTKNRSDTANLKSMFEKQLSGASSSKDSSEELMLGTASIKKRPSTEQNLHPNTQPMDVEPSTSCAIPSTQDMCATSSEIQSILNPTMHSFTRSPFAAFALSPQDSTMSGTQPQVALATASTINQQQPSQGSGEADEHLCVICEDGKKQVVLLPCKHMCLCKACADFDKIKECPLCRTKIDDSMAVFI